MRESQAVDGFDREVPLVLVKVGHYPLHHGTVGAIRSLGRLGVPVYAVTEDRFTPAAVSRYLRGCLVWPTSGLEDQDWLVDGLARVGRRLPRRAVAVATDDEAAILLAEHATELAEWFILPDVAPGLPRMLASKRGLHDLCRRHGIATPQASFPTSRDEVESFAAQATFPVVVKNVDPWARLHEPAVAGTTIVATPDELQLLAKGWPSRLNVLLQEYIPRDQAEDWIFHAYCDHDSDCPVGFTGVKLRSWPPHAGVTTYAVTVTNAQLAGEASRLCRLLGFRGVVDLDWRFDRRDGRYKLVDFNPRLGAQFRLFQSEAGIDVVRALHLDLTGRAVPRQAQVDGRRLVVENLDAAAFLSYPKDGRRPWSSGKTGGATELAWAVPDDPVPMVAMGTRFAWVVGLRLAHGIRLRFRRWWRPERLSRRWRPGPSWLAQPARAGGRSSKGS